MTRKKRKTSASRENDADSGDHTVGYGKPPAHSRFKPGRSGNPKGRTPGVANSKTIVERVFNSVIPVREGAREQKLTKKECLITTTINSGLQKSGKDRDAAFRLLAQVEDEAESRPPSSMSQAEQEILAAHEARLRKQFEAEQAAKTVADQPSNDTQEKKT